MHLAQKPWYLNISLWNRDGRFKFQEVRTEGSNVVTTVEFAGQFVEQDGIV